MLRAGFDIAAFAWLLNALALAFGAYLGGRALIDPIWAQRFVRLKPDEQGGGFAEFRATYGGVFLMLHLAALAFTLKWIIDGELLIGLYAAGASAPVAAGWAGSSGGRLISMWRDKTGTDFNKLSAAVEAGMALAVAAPWLLWSFQGQG